MDHIIEKVKEIVVKQLDLPYGTAVASKTNLYDLGGGSLDAVEIVIALEKEFGVSVEESSAQAISTVEDAAKLIAKLINQK